MTKIIGNQKELRIIVNCGNIYEYRLFRDRLKHLQPIIEEYENNPKSKGGVEKRWILKK